MRRAAVVAAIVGALAVMPAQAASCTVANATLAFGSYSPVAASPSLSNTSITVTCTALLGAGSTATVPYTALLSAGNSGSTASRRMTAGSANLPYNIYTSATYGTVWDNSTGVAGSVLLSGPLGVPVLVSGSDTRTGFGRIAIQQAAAAGAYGDSLVITVNY